MKKEKLKKIIDWLFEISVLKKIKRSGWRNIGIENPDSVAEHIFLTTQIAYILGKMEKINAERAALISLFHDTGEARIGDLNLLSKIYLKTEKAEEKAFFDQIKNLPAQKEIENLYKEWKEQKTKESIVARDADWLEAAVQAKIYLDSGNKLAKLWIDYYENQLKTKSAKKLIGVLKKTKIDDWWKKIPQIKKEIKKLHGEKRKIGKTKSRN